MNTMTWEAIFYFGAIPILVLSALWAGWVIYQENFRKPERKKARNDGIYIGHVSAGEHGSVRITASVGKNKVRISTKKKLQNQRKARLRIKDGAVYNVSDPLTGRSVIVHAINQEEARLVAAKNLGADEDELDAIEVYDKVLRK